MGFVVPECDLRPFFGAWIWRQRDWRLSLSNFGKGPRPSLNPSPDRPAATETGIRVSFIESDTFLKQKTPLAPRAIGRVGGKKPGNTGSRKHTYVRPLASRLPASPEGR
jgi:hypothetical protein